MPSALSYVLVAVVYLAGAYASAESGWVATVRLLKLKPGLGRAVLIAVAEAFIGLGTGALAVTLAAWIVPDRVLTLALAAAVGVAAGVFRQIKAFRKQAEGYHALDEVEESPSSARSAVIANALLREVQFGAAARLVGVGAVFIGVVVEALTR